MNILELAILKKMVGGGGGSGTDNYNELSNLPQINGETLAGNKTAENLGLQDEITSENKLDADLVDDEESTNKFVTAQDKETWNAKQNAIDSSNKLSSDLVDDTNHTNKFVTSTEKQTWNGKQNAIDSDHKLSSSLVSYTTAEAAALASGIDSSKVGQISTNQTNILSVSDANGSKNLYNATITTTSGNGFTVQKNADNSYTVSGTQLSDINTWIQIGDVILPKDVYFLSGGTEQVQLAISVAGSAQYDSGNGKTLPDSAIDAPLYILIPSGVASITTPITIYPMICLKSLYDISPTYQPYSLPNTLITPELIELCDSGAKNLLDFANAVFTDVKATSTKTSTAITITAASNGDWSRSYTSVNLDAGSYVFTTTISNYSKTVGAPVIYIASSATGENPYGIATITGNGTIICSFNIPTTGTYYLCYYVNDTATASGVSCSYTASNNMICTQAAWNVSHKYVPYRPNWDLVSSAPFYSVPINHNMIYRGQNLGATFTDAQHTALSSGNFTDLYLGDYWTKSVTIPDFYELTTAQPSDWTTNYTSYYTKSGDTYTPVTGGTAPTWAADTYYEKSVPTQTVTLKAVIADFDTFYAGYASGYAGINTHHAAVIVTGFNNVVWNKTNTTVGGYVNSLIHKWLVGSALPQIETWFGSAKVLSHQKLLTNEITGDAASGWAWSSQKISLLSECQLYGMKVWGGSKATNGAYEPGEAFKKLDVFNHIDANLLFGNRNIWCRDIASAVWAAGLRNRGYAYSDVASDAGVAPAALILLS